MFVAPFNSLATDALIVNRQHYWLFEGKPTQPFEHQTGPIIAFLGHVKHTFVTADSNQTTRCSPLGNTVDGWA